MENSGRLLILMAVGFAVVIGLAAGGLHLPAVKIPAGTPPPKGTAPALPEPDQGEEMASLVEVREIPRSYGLRSIKPFQVFSRSEQLEAYPCSDCHEDEPVNSRERKLTEDHEDKLLDHGGGRFWCLTCHGSKDKDTLTSLKGKPISFDASFILCGQCHFQRQKDWYFGGHGKRLSGWLEPRRVKVCPECHDPHSPSIKPFKPSPPPKVRKGLAARSFVREAHPPIWVRLQDPGREN